MALTSHEPKFTTKTIAYLARIESYFQAKIIKYLSIVRRIVTKKTPTYEESGNH